MKSGSIDSGMSVNLVICQSFTLECDREWQYWEIQVHASTTDCR